VKNAWGTTEVYNNEKRMLNIKNSPGYIQSADA